MKVRYLEAVATAKRTVDRTAWALMVETWRRNIADGNQTTLAKMLNVTPKTIGRWLREEVDVSEENVRIAAEAIGRNPMELLVQVGFYTVEEVAAAAGVAVAPPQRSELDALENDIARIEADTELDPAMREEMLRIAREMLRDLRTKQDRLNKEQARLVREAKEQGDETRRRLADLLRIARHGIQPRRDTQPTNG